MIRLVSWNLAGHDLLGDLHGFDVDIALLQEACLPTPGSALQVVPADPTTWWTCRGPMSGVRATTVVSSSEGGRGVLTQDVHWGRSRLARAEVDGGHESAVVR